MVDARINSVVAKFGKINEKLIRFSLVLVKKYNENVCVIFADKIHSFPVYLV